MGVIDPIYSIEKDCEVYHNHSECTERNNIETRNVRAGTGNKRLCNHCKKLTAAEFFQTRFGIAGGLIGGISNSIFAARLKK